MVAVRVYVRGGGGGEARLPIPHQVGGDRSEARAEAALREAVAEQLSLARTERGAAVYRGHLARAGDFALPQLAGGDGGSG
eukprot:CAMPEP_0179898776 /NCGR_PEP_ID=MMETSP0982-20121206/37871_1 /TAXON_ID=483367 /ORGANISM="non described non described, Strain CCMP 2436" /LENGTH=80 /DNA_ID=CAMNT_0021796199 /DNA_START=63 /DNA_END=301 /DNA_ORIENTATION=-